MERFVSGKGESEAKRRVLLREVKLQYVYMLQYTRNYVYVCAVAFSLSLKLLSFMAFFHLCTAAVLP